MIVTRFVMIFLQAVGLWRESRSSHALVSYLELEILALSVCYSRYNTENYLQLSKF